MEWRLVLGLWLLRYITITASHPHIVSLPLVDESFSQSLDNIGDETSEPAALYEDIKLEHLGKLLANVLVEPWPQGISPILYIEEIPPPTDDQSIENNLLEPEINNIPFKRSRYYRKYPWKRQNSRYDAENKYLCQPSKEDVFRLLVALHEARRGSREQMVNFCNRKRPAASVFTNIRFLG